MKLTIVVVSCWWGKLALHIQGRR